jgi:hypothetical protein
VRVIHVTHHASGERIVADGGNTQEQYEQAVQEVVDFMFYIALDDEPMLVLNEIYISAPDGTPHDLKVSHDILGLYIRMVYSSRNQ